ENSFDYWVGVPRRHRLKCFVPSLDRKEQVYMSLPDAEKHLGKEPYKTKHTASGPEDESMDGSSVDESNHAESPYQSSHISESDDSDESGASSVYYSSSDATSAWSADGEDSGLVPTLT